MAPRNTSVAATVIITIVIVTTAYLCGLFLVIDTIASERWRGQLRKEQTLLADQLSESLAFPLWNFDTGQIGKIMESAMKSDNVFAVEVKTTGKQGRTFVRIRDAEWKITGAEQVFLTKGLLAEERDIYFSHEQIGIVRVIATSKLIDLFLHKNRILMTAILIPFELILAVSLYLLLWRLVLKPLKEVETYAGAVSSGSVAAGVIHARLYQGELENLRSSIGTMVDTLMTREDELVRYKEHLEDLVQERTAGLQDANAKLQREIEARARIEKALAASETKYRDIVESANSVILRWTPEGTIIFFNTFAQNFFGYPGDEILGRNIYDTIVPLQDSVGNDMSALASDIMDCPEEFVINENENIRKNKERVWVMWTNRPIRDEQGRAIEILSIGVDITKRVQAEKELRTALADLAVAKEHAEAADRLKSAFLATMSHELRTPLNSIIGFTGILIQGLAGPLNEEQIKQLGMVRESSTHLLDLINDVLDISKIEAGQLQVAKEPFDLRAVIEKTALTVRPMVEKKDLLLEVVLAPEVGMLTSDRRRVEQALLNLLSNAVKFTEKGGISITCGISGRELIIGVKDTGIGIKPEEMDKLFKPFQQLQSGIGRQYEGTGLGLSISKRLVELLGGTISVKSERGQGSTFTITLPVTMI